MTFKHHRVHRILHSFGALAAVTFLGCGQPSPPTPLFVVHRGPVGCTNRIRFTSNGLTDRHLVALSFDGGVSPETPSLFDTLRQYHATGTFFLVGHLVQGHRNLLRAMVGDGMEIGNQSVQLS